MHVGDGNDRKIHKLDSSGESKDSLIENLSLKSITDETDGYLSRASEEGHLVEADGRQIMNVQGDSEYSHKSDYSDEMKNSSKSNSALNSIMNEAVGILSQTWEDRRLVEADNGNIIYTQGVDKGTNEDKSHRSESSDESKESSIGESTTSLDSIMNEAVGFLSRTSDEGRLIEADDGRGLYVRGVNNL